MIATHQRVTGGRNALPECMQPKNPHDSEVIVENGKDLEHHQVVSSNSRDKPDGKQTESRKRIRKSSQAENDDDIMVLSNSPCSSEVGEGKQLECVTIKPWETSSLPIGMFSLPNQSLVNTPLYSTDPSAFMSAMGSQVTSYDVCYFYSIIGRVHQQSNKLFCSISLAFFPL